MTRYLVITMIASQIGLALSEAAAHNWRTAGVSILVAAANTLMFWK